MLSASMGLLVFSTITITLLQQWRLAGPALVLYSAALAMAHGAALGPTVGALKLVATLAAVGVLAWSSAAEPTIAPVAWRPLSRAGLGQSLLLAAIAVAVLGAYRLALAWPIGGLAILSFAGYWLLGIGTLLLVTARAVVRLGLGLLLLLGAAELLHTCLSRTPDVAFLGGAATAQVLLALAVARIAATTRAQREGVGR